MPELKINGYTFATQANGNNPVLASNVNLGSATFPAGHVVNIYTAGYMSNTTIDASMAAGGTPSNSDNLTHDVRFNTGNRVFVKLVGKTVNITSGNGVIVSGWVGFDNITRSDKGAWGCVFKVPDALGNNRAYQGGNYPYYQASQMPAYPPDWSGVVYVGTGAANTNDTIGRIIIPKYCVLPRIDEKYKKNEIINATTDNA
mgnify:CR=1 FL=1